MLGKVSPRCCAPVSYICLGQTSGTSPRSSTPHGRYQREQKNISSIFHVFVRGFFLSQGVLVPRAGRYHISATPILSCLCVTLLTNIVRFFYVTFVCFCVVLCSSSVSFLWAQISPKPIPVCIYLDVCVCQLSGSFVLGPCPSCQGLSLIHI